MCHYLGGGLHGRKKRVKAQSESSKSVVNSVLISREMPVFPGFLEIIRVVTLTELERYPFSYTFMNEEAGIRFTVYSTLHSQKDQSHFLKKLYDKSNRHIVFEDVLIGGYTYIVYTIEQATYDYGFLVRTDNGYSYQFQYALPYDRIQNEIPEDAISILSTMVIHETPIPDQLGMENRHAH